MGRKFWCADLHLGHKRMEQERPWSSIVDHDNTITDNWNRVVTDDDLVFVLGDATTNRHAVQKIRRLNGQKYLIAGNHDDFFEDYTNVFDKVLPMAQQSGFLATHIPIHPLSVVRWGANVHGHLHKEVINDYRYLCVSMEQINYTPITTEDVMNRLRMQRVQWEEFESIAHIMARIDRGEEVNEFGLTTYVKLLLSLEDNVQIHKRNANGNVLAYSFYKRKEP